LNPDQDGGRLGAIHEDYRGTQCKAGNGTHLCGDWQQAQPETQVHQG